MKKIPITITSVSSAYRGVMFLSKTLCNELRIQPGVYQVQCGGITLPVRVMYPMFDRPSNFALSQDLLDDLGLIEGTKLYLYQEEGVLRIGPVFGILADIRYQSGDVRGQQAPIFEQLLSLAAEERMYAYVFGLQDIQSKSVIRGVILNKKNGRLKWQMRNVPFPDVVYDQIISRKFENMSEVVSLKHELVKRLQSSYFNPGFFDKWQIHEWLSKNENTKKYMPDTIRYQTKETASEFIDQYKQVYIKPIHGSLGVGIIKLIRLADGRTFYQIKGAKGVHSQGYGKSAKSILKKLNYRFSRHPFIIQQGLTLQTYQNRPFDIRIIMQKDGSGKWKRTKSFCRIAQTGDITSNLSTGGDAIPLSKVLQEIYANKEEIQKIQKKIRTLVNTVPSTLEQESELQLGEMGLDIGIDSKGEIWIIEVNSKPWKKPFTDQGSMEVVKESFRRPLLYGKYLTGTM